MRFQPSSAARQITARRLPPLPWGIRGSRWPRPLAGSGRAAIDRSSSGPPARLATVCSTPRGEPVAASARCRPKRVIRARRSLPVGYLRSIAKVRSRPSSGTRPPFSDSAEQRGYRVHGLLGGRGRTASFQAGSPAPPYRRASCPPVTDLLPRAGAAMMASCGHVELLRPGP